jgi:hypothetical protein
LVLQAIGLAQILAQPAVPQRVSIRRAVRGARLTLALPDEIDIK